MNWGRSALPASLNNAFKKTCCGYANIFAHVPHHHTAAALLLFACLFGEAVGEQGLSTVIHVLSLPHFSHLEVCHLLLLAATNPVETSRMVRACWDHFQMKAVNQNRSVYPLVGFPFDLEEKVGCCCPDPLLDCSQ